MVYIRKFDTRGSHMVLTNTLQGHEGEVNCVAWNDICSKWVTASEDGTVRIWVSKHRLQENHQCKLCIFDDMPHNRMLIQSWSGLFLVHSSYKRQILFLKSS